MGASFGGKKGGGTVTTTVSKNVTNLAIPLADAQDERRIFVPLDFTGNAVPGEVWTIIGGKSAVYPQAVDDLGTGAKLKAAIDASAFYIDLQYEAAPTTRAPAYQGAATTFAALPIAAGGAIAGDTAAMSVTETIPATSVSRSFTQAAATGTPATWAVSTLVPPRVTYSIPLQEFQLSFNRAGNAPATTGETLRAIFEDQTGTRYTITTTASPTGITIGPVIPGSVGRLELVEITNVTRGVPLTTYRVVVTALNVAQTCPAGLYRHDGSVYTLSAPFGIMTAPPVSGQYAGSGATFATLPTANRDATVLSTGDFAELLADDIGTGSAAAPQYPAGRYAWNGTAWALDITTPDIPSAATAIATTAPADNAALTNTQLYLAKYSIDGKPVTL